MGVLDEFKRAVASGKATLIVADTIFSNESQTTCLRRLRTRLLGPANVSDDNGLSITEILVAARLSDPEATSVLLRESAETGDTVELLHILTQGPWQRVYDLVPRDPAQMRDAAGATQIAFSDATTDFALVHDRLQWVSICGQLGIPSAVDFDPPTGAGVTSRDLWFRQFSADLISGPLVVITAQAHPELWKFLRQRMIVSGVEIPPGFYICSDLSSADRLRCGNHALRPIQMAAELFARQYLISSVAEISEGHRRIARIRNDRGVRVGVRLVSGLVRSGKTPSWDFLRGRDPQWEDVASERTVRLKRVSVLRKELSLEHKKRNVVIFKGRAGSGKTATLMRLAYELDKGGRTVGWIDRAVSDRLADVNRHAEELDLDVVVIDDIDIFGESAVAFARTLNRKGRTLVVASVRATKNWTLGTLPPGMQLVDGDFELTDHDLTQLAGRLGDAGLLGILTGLSGERRVARLRELSQRDLLSALIEVVSGEPFDQRVRSECEELPREERKAYATVSFQASRVFETLYIPEADLIQVLSATPPYSDAAGAIDDLVVGKKLLIREPAGIRVRHRAIADAVVDGLERSEIADIAGTMLEFYAGRAAGITDPSHPDRRQMVRLLSHSRLKELKLKVEQARAIYARVQPLLQEDFHYWLQRGAYEVERGDLDLADSYLESARRLPGGYDDYKVTTEWGFMSLRKAIESPENATAQYRAVGVIRELERVARREGSRSPHTFTILLRHGTEWLESTDTVSERERLALALSVREVCRLGEKVCADNRDFARAARESAASLNRLISAETARFPLA